MRKIVISDIHGCCNTFKKLLHKQVELTLEDELYLLGDYIDRGPSSKQVIDHILQLRKEGFQIHCLRGNHEEMMLNARYGGFKKSRHFMINGGVTTMDSFNADTYEQIDEKYWDFLNSLEYYKMVDNYILVHAGLNFRTASPLSDTENMVWIRAWYDEINHEWLKDRIIVHGHTITSVNLVKLSLERLDILPVIDIDTGCYATAIRGSGHLCALNLGSQELYFQENIDEMDARFTS